MWNEFSKLNTSRHRRPAKAVSLKKICCFFVARLRSRPFCPVRIVVVSERNIFLPRRLAFLIFVRSKKQRENCPFRLANFKTRWCREWKEKLSAPPVAKILFPGLLRQKKIWKIPVQRVAGGLSNVSLAKGKKTAHSGLKAPPCSLYVRKSPDRGSLRQS